VGFEDEVRKFCVDNSPTQAAWDTLLGNLTTNNAAARNIAIEFECGDCCKKVLNGDRLIPIISLGIVVLLPPSGSTLLIKLFSGGQRVETQMARAIIIPIDRICAVEFGAVQVDGVCPV
jgi:hypothetical protein